MAVVFSTGDCDGDGVTNANEINGPDGVAGGVAGTNPLDPCSFNLSQVTLTAFIVKVTKTHNMIYSLLNLLADMAGNRPRRKRSKTPLTKKQQKARAASKRAKRARKLNYKK